MKKKFTFSNKGFRGGKGANYFNNYLAFQFIPERISIRKICLVKKSVYIYNRRTSHTF